MKMKVVPCAIALLLSFASPALAAELTVRPFLIDETVEAREVLTRDITLVNEVANKIIVYATVNEITVDETGEIKQFVSPMSTDRTNTVTSWVEITRARIVMEANETKTVPLTLRIHPKAEPGEYHLFIGMVPAANQPAAEAKALAGDADGVIVKVTVDDTKEESLHISDFSTKRFIMSNADRTIAVEVENKGDAASSPRGEIIFYDSHGEEVGSTKFNDAGEEVIPAGEKKVFRSDIPLNDTFGRFKATVTLRYGNNGDSTIFDTTQFYFVPYKLLAILVAAIVIFSLLVTMILRRFFDDDTYDDDEDGKAVPVFVQTGREFKEMDHDITLKKN